MKNDWWWLSLASTLYRCNKNFISLHLIRGSGIRISHHMPSGEAAEKAMIYLWITALPPSTGLAKAEQQNGKPTTKPALCLALTYIYQTLGTNQQQSPSPASSRMAARPEKWLPHIWRKELFGEAKLQTEPSVQASEQLKTSPGFGTAASPRWHKAHSAPRVWRRVRSAPAPASCNTSFRRSVMFGTVSFRILSEMEVKNYTYPIFGPSGHHTLCIWKYSLLNKLSCFRSCKQSTLWYPPVHAIKAGHAKSWYRHLSVRRQWLESSQKIHCTQRLRSTPSSLADGFNPGNPWKPATAFGKGSINSEKH